jgi:hypothetical protein
MSLLSNDAGVMGMQRRYHSTAVDGLFICFDLIFLIVFYFLTLLKFKPPMYIFRVKPHIGYILLRHNRYMLDIFVCCILLRRSTIPRTGRRSGK